MIIGVVPEWLKGADCKSAGVSLRWFEPTPRHHFLVRAGVAQLVERHPSKVDVESSNLFARSILKNGACVLTFQLNYALVAQW